MQTRFGFKRASRALAVVAVASSLTAGTFSATAQEMDAAPVNTGNVSFSAGIDLTTMYLFRGIPQENQGVIAQPWFDLGFQVTDAVTFNVGIWNSAQDNAPSNNSGVDVWYEADIYFGVGFDLSSLVEGLSLGITHTSLTSPNGGFDTIHEVGVTVGYDDSNLWGDSGVPALSPYITVVFEYDNQADLGTDEGVYFEIGIGPSFEIVQGDWPITLTVPLTLAFGSDYYEDGAGNDDGFGFFDIGADFSVPLPMPGEFGSWSAWAGVHFISLGDSASNIGGPGGFNVTDGDDNFIYGTIGISMEY